MGLAGVVVFLLLLFSITEAKAEREDFENSIKPQGPEFLDKSTMEILVGSTGSAPKESRESQETEKPLENPSNGSLSSEMLPEMPGNADSGFDDSIDWTDFENSAEAKNLPDTAIDGLLEEGIPADSGEGPKSSATVEDQDKNLQSVSQKSSKE